MEGSSRCKKACARLPEQSPAAELIDDLHTGSLHSFQRLFLIAKNRTHHLFSRLGRSARAYQQSRIFSE
jgi:hypothetical protein